MKSAILRGVTAIDDALAQLAALAETDETAAARLIHELSTQPKPGDPFPVPMFPPLEWFQPDAIPAGVEPMKATVTPEGQVYGYFFEWGTCIAGSGVYDKCWTAPPSPTGYNLFHQSDHIVLDSSGNKVTVKAGLIVPSHADPDESEESQREHYDDPRNAAVIVRAYEDEVGGFIVGSVRPGATWGQATLARNAPLSGHWNYGTRDAATAYWDCIGPVMVVRPALALERGRSMTAGLRVLARDDAGRPVEVRGGIVEGSGGQTIMSTPTATPTPTVEPVAPVTANAASGDGGGGCGGACRCNKPSQAPATEPAEPAEPAGDGSGDSDGVESVTAAAEPDDNGAPATGIAELTNRIAGLAADLSAARTAINEQNAALERHEQAIAELQAAGMNQDPVIELDTPPVDA